MIAKQVVDPMNCSMMIDPPPSFPLFSKGFAHLKTSLLEFLPSISLPFLEYSGSVLALFVKLGLMNDLA